MSQNFNKYTAVREYRNDYSIEEMLRRIIRIHIRMVEPDMNDFKECSGHEVIDNEK